MISKTSVRDALKSSPPGLRAIFRVLLLRPLRFYIRFAPWQTGKLFLFEALAEHLWWLEANVDAKTVDGDVLRVDASDIVGKHIYYFGVWEPNLTGWLNRRLKPGQLFIDVGANIGYYSLLAARLVGSAGKVVAIEALPQTFQRLQGNLDRNHAQNVRAVNSAAWDKQTSLKIFVRQEGPSGATTLISAWADRWNLRQQVEIIAAPLAMTLTAAEIESARIIKIDVEGAEWHVITEMTSWLARTAADLEITLEVSSSMMNSQGKSFDDVLSLFSGFGFQAYRVENDYLASSCLYWRKYRAPYRLTKWPAEAVDQIDVIFSRINADFL
jgi:FkbM family methyltransferase